jgi:hypothetical protein
VPASGSLVSDDLEHELGPTDGGTVSMPARTRTESAAVPVADTHDMIRVHGARVNNLKDVSIEVP